MKDTIRLSQRNKARLCSFDDDANRAIEMALDAHDQLKVKLETRDEFSAVLRAPIDKLTERFSSDCKTTACVPSVVANCNTTGFTTAASYSASSGPPEPTAMGYPVEVYWKTFDQHIERAIEKAQRGF